MNDFLWIVGTGLAIALVRWAGQGFPPFWRKDYGP